jgi:hypothetical protein
MSGGKIDPMIEDAMRRFVAQTVDRVVASGLDLAHRLDALKSEQALIQAEMFQLKRAMALLLTELADVRDDVAKPGGEIN